MKFSIKYISFFLSAILLAHVFSSCEDMFDLDSDKIAFDDQHTISSPNDTVYSVMGILSQIQRLGEKYVVLGELRGDLMSVSEDASVYLKEINSFEVNADNIYREKHDYYKVINNCNYVLNRMDTSIVMQGQKVLLPEFAAVKVMRAWTYWQLALAFGEVEYYTEPVLSLEQSQAQYPVVDMDALAELLVADLLPYINVRGLDYGEIDGKSSNTFFLPIRALLGDLYLFLNKYEQAAQMYHDLIYSEYYILSPTMYGSYWANLAQDNVYLMHTLSYGSEMIAGIPYSSELKDYHSNLVQMSYNYNPSLVPVQSFINEMEFKRHFHAMSTASAISAYFEGDLRGSIKSSKLFNELGDAYMSAVSTPNGTIPLIYKFYNISSYGGSGSSNVEENSLLNGLSYIMTYIPIYRIPHIYLRYAEAVNRAGKPSLAFSVLKYGLNNANMNTPSMVNPAEVENMESYIDFRTDATMFNQTNFGSAARGRGLGISKDTEYFIIPDFNVYSEETDEDGEIIYIPSTDPTVLAKARQDSINYVEEMILEEMAAETAYEGNRFFDLLRMSRRRDNHPAFMAEKVSEKYDNPAAMKSRLNNLNAWFIK